MTGTSSLAGRSALVTGGGTGIGLAIARRLVGAGAKVAITGRDAQRLQEASASLGLDTSAIEADITSVQAVETMVKAVVDAWGHIDILVNNAGIIRPNAFGSVTEQDWDESFAVNAKGLFFSMQAAVPHIPEGGCIVNIASIAGRGTATSSPPYAASKAAAINVTQTTARALASRRIRVNAVCPGFVDTDFQVRLDKEFLQQRQGLPPGEGRRRWEASNPLGRVATADEVAAAVIYLASADAALITGQTLNLDGGVVIY